MLPESCTLRFLAVNASSGERSVGLSEDTDSRFGVEAGRLSGDCGGIN